ncbi:MAG: hypothetical protein Ct9H90mP16_06390 [Candidatus Poseidoniales archaeon]|nr:MAG: hypothetical protein Ct9H90mP16_06390 [Candidatus Poseidoniales archaeon]
MVPSLSDEWSRLHGGRNPSCCDTIEEGDLIWIRDQSHGKPLAIGWGNYGLQ